MSLTATLGPLGLRRRKLPASGSIEVNKLTGSTQPSEFDERRHKRNCTEHVNGFPAPPFSIAVLLASSRVITRFGNGGSLSHVPNWPSWTESTRARASGGRAGASSMCMPSLALRCKKWGRIYPASLSHRLLAADMVVVFLVVGGDGGGGGKKRRSGGHEEVGDEAGRRCVLIVDRQ